MWLRCMVCGSTSNKMITPHLSWLGEEIRRGSKPFQTMTWSKLGALIGLPPVTISVGLEVGQSTVYQQRVTYLLLLLPEWYALALIVQIEAFSFTHWYGRIRVDIGRVVRWLLGGSIIKHIPPAKRNPQPAEQMPHAK